MRKTLPTKPPAPAAPAEQIIADKDLLWYVKEICGGTEVFTFATQEETDAFGAKLRANNDGNTEVNIEVSYLTVRVRVGSQK
jgi:hypothetical protein